MNKTEQVAAETINTYRFFIIFMSYLVGGTYLSFGIAATFHSAIIAMIGLVLFSILPITLMGLIINLFKKKIYVIFFDDHLLLDLFSLKADVLLEEKKLFYKELSSCTISSIRNGYSVIYFNLLNGTKIKYTFKSSLADKSINLSEKNYKNIKFRDNNITLKPTFFASNIGAYYIIGLGIFMSILILLHFFYSPGTSFFSFIIGVSLFMNILSKRKRDMDLYNKLQN